MAKLTDVDLAIRHLQDEQNYLRSLLAAVDTKLFNYRLTAENHGHDMQLHKLFNLGYCTKCGCVEGGARSREECSS